MKKLLLLFFFVCLVYGAFSQNVTSHKRVGIGTGPHATIPVYILGTTEQFRSAYDGSNYLSLTIASDGEATFAVTGGGAFTFSNAIQVGNLNFTGNTIISTDTNGDINLDPDALGDVNINSGDFIFDTSADDLYVGTSAVIDGSGYFHGITSDGSDNADIYVNGGGDIGPSRGGQVFLRGNEVASFGGSINLNGGEVATGDIVLDLGHASSEIQFGGTSGTEAFMNNSGTWDYNNNIILDVGQLGVGVTSVSREMEVGAASGFAEIAIRGASGSGASLEFYDDTTLLGDIFIDASNNLTFRNTSTALVFNSSQVATMSSLAGSGTRSVTASSTGVLGDTPLITVSSGQHVENGGNTQSPGGRSSESRI